MIFTKLARAASLCGLILLSLLLPLAAQAASDSFNGGAVGNCTYDSPSKTYSCSTLSTSNDIAIASGYTVVLTGSVTFDFNQQLNMSGSARLQATGTLNIGNIKPSNLNISGGVLAADTFIAGVQAQTFTADISAATINIGTGSATKVTGKLTATSQLTLASNVSVIGDIKAPTVLIKASNTSVKGNIDASTGITIESNNTVNGNITGGTLTMNDGGVVINGNATMTGDVSIGSSSVINGDLGARNVTTHSSNSGVNGNASVNAIYLDWNTSVSKTITCTGAAPGAPVCSCVTRADANYHPTCGAAPAVGPHHIQISHSGTALTCQPQTVTLTACANANCTPPHSSASTTVTLLPGGKQFPIVNGVNNAATVEWAKAETVTLSSSSHAYTCINSSDASHPCEMVFKTSGLTVTAPNHVSMAGATVSIQALTAASGNQSCVPLVADKTVSVDIGCSYGDPASGTVRPKIGTTSLTCGSSTTGVQLSFNASGIATAALEYADVGKVNLTASYAYTGGGTAFNAVGGNNFIAAPKEFIIVATNAVTNVSTASTHDIFAKASEPFTIKVNAVNALGNITKNFGREATPENVVFQQPVVANPAGTGNNGVITKGLFDAFSNGVADSKNGSAGQWSFSDVGAIKLDAKLANTSTYYMGYNALDTFATKGTLVISRFIPDHFDTALMTESEITALAATQPGGRTMSCDNLVVGVNPCAGASTRFIYSAQPFFLKVLAYNGASPTPGLTSNYAGPLSKAITVSAWTAAGGAVGVAASIGALSWNGVDPKFSFSTGTGMPASPGPLNANLPRFTFAKAYPENILPATIYLRAVDTDLVTSLRGGGAVSVEAPLTVVSGRLYVANAYGSQNSPLPIDASAQYYMPSGYVFNSQVNAVSATSVASKIAFSVCQKALDVSGNGSQTCPGGTSLKAANTTDVLTLVNGKGKFRMAAPTPTLTGIGSTNVSLGTLFDYLPSSFGRATFGIYRSGPVIYTREVHN